MDRAGRDKKRPAARIGQWDSSLSPSSNSKHISPWMAAPPDSLPRRQCPRKVPPAIPARCRRITVAETLPEKTKIAAAPPPGSQAALAYHTPPATVDVSMIKWPKPPVQGRRDFHTRGPGKPLATSSAAVYSTNAVQEYTSDGIGVMQMLLQKWHKSIAANQRYYRSFTVYGQVKLQEARNATAFLGPGPNNTTTLAAGEILCKLFSSLTRTRTLRMHIPTQPPCLANFFKCEHNFNQPSLGGSSQGHGACLKSHWVITRLL